MYSRPARETKPLLLVSGIDEELGLGEGDEVPEGADEAGRPVLGVPDVCQVGVVRVEQGGDGELVLGEQRRVLVGVERGRQGRVDLRVALERDGDVLHLRDGLVAVADLVQHQRPPHARVLGEGQVLVPAHHRREGRQRRREVAPGLQVPAQVEEPHGFPDAEGQGCARRALRFGCWVVGGGGC